MEEALSHIQELLSTLNSKIEEIDLVFVLAVHDGDEVTEDQSQHAQVTSVRYVQKLIENCRLGYMWLSHTGFILLHCSSVYLI